ncbi:hypothetical protein BLA29_014810, partial [Euroglyphus maynei]
MNPMINHPISSSRDLRYYSVIAALWLPIQQNNDQQQQPNSIDTWINQRQQALNRWGLLRVNGNEYNAYICKLRKED